MTFRARLLLTSLVVLGVGLGALVVAGNVLLDQRVRDEASNLLRARIDTQVAALRVTPNRVAVRETPNDEQLDKRAWVFGRQSQVIEEPSAVPPELDRAAARAARSGTVVERPGTDDFRLRAQPVRAPETGKRVGTVVVALDVAPLETLQEQVLGGSVVIAVLVMVAGGLAIRGAVVGALHPVARMTESAADWSEHDLSHRFALGPARDELTGLAATLDGLLERIASSRRHEQRFASEVAHELRTPLAGLRGRSELALEAEGPSADRERADALRAVVAQADRLGATIDDLLALARQELDPTGGTADLAELAHEHLEGEGEPTVEVRDHDDVPLVEGEPDVVRRALAPLVDNARRHARSRVVLDLSAAEQRVRLEVRDDGPGVDLATAEALFEPGVRRGEGGGAGLGLSLARRLARSCGGEVRVEAGQADGSCFVLDLPAVPRSRS